MSTDEQYIYGNQNVQLPAHLNFGKYMLDQIRKMNNEIALENFETKEKLTYRELTQYTVNLATSLMRIGVGIGDIVAVGSEKRNTFLPTVLAIVFTGATYTPYDLNSGRAVLKHKLSITQPKYFICSNLFWKMNSDVLSSFECIKTFITLDDAPTTAITVKSLISNDVDVNKFEPVTVDGKNDTAFILYSSGTTGMPKGVCLTHLNCILNSMWDEYKDETLKTVFVFGEWYHNYDTFMSYKFLLAGRKVVYVNEPTQHTILQCLQDCQVATEHAEAKNGRCRPWINVTNLDVACTGETVSAVNIAMLVPSHIGYMSKADIGNKYNLNSLKIIYSRSSPLHSKTVERLKQRFPSLQDVLQGYGMTECGELTSENWGTKGSKSGSVGMASPGITLKISDPETNKTLGPNQHGEIRITGPVLMKGYIGVDPSTYLDPEGFFKTGDLGYYDDDKYFYIVDRMKEIISYDGYKIAPLELETILLLHPGVREAGVVGKPVPVYGEEPAAFVVKQPGANITEKDLVNYVAMEVPPFMQLIGGVKFIEKIPRNPRGKILRRALREMLSQFSE